MRGDIFGSVKAVFFDLDNTLISRDLSFREILPLWFAAYVPDLPETDYGVQITQIMLRDQGGFADRDEFGSWVHRRYSLKTISEKQVISDFAASIAGNIKRNEEVIDFVQSLRERYTIGVISNGSGRTQRTKLSNAGLESAFDADKIYIEGERGIAKPDLAMFLLPCQQHHISPGETLFIGDHPVDDIRGASNAGMKTCWIRRGESRSDLACSPDVTINSIEELFHLAV